jgi:hypothetical protein
MRKLAVAVLSLISCSPVLWAKDTPQEAPQTARQALMEMFFSKEPGTFLKHLPAVTRATLEKSGALATLQQYSLLAGQLQTQGGKSLQTFETGSVMLAFDDPKTSQKVELVVENDVLRGEQDDIELSFHTYKENQAQRTPFMPRVVFSMKMESGLWTLNEIAVTITLPLADPDLLKVISDGMTARTVGTNPQLTQRQLQPQGQPSMRTLGSDASILTAVRMVLAAEATYSATYPAVGYTCTLSDLDGFGAAQASEHQAMLINSGLASGRYHGYSFSLSQCTAAGFRLTAAPTGDSYGRRAFCADQSGAIRASADGTAATCMSSGTPVP